jgi:transcriptional regulator with XRE-family HTH domain
MSIVEVDDDIGARLAAKVRALRTSGGLSLDALAARSGVSRSMISAIERREVSATAVVLNKLATAFGLTIGSLFDDDVVAVQPVTRRRDQVVWRDPETGYTRRAISSDGRRAPVRIAEIEFPPGATVEFDNLQPAVHQHVWVLKGHIEVTVGEVTYPLARGDCLAMWLDVPTRFRNRSDQVARYVVVTAADAGPRR